LYGDFKDEAFERASITRSIPSRQVLTYTRPPKAMRRQEEIMFGPGLYLREGIKTITNLELSKAELIDFAQHMTESKLQRLLKMIPKLRV
jgi:hypothetical protein